MVISRKTQDKENNVEGVRKAKAAPDFSKLHKQWDAKLQKGKAVGKKPLTSVQPFDLTHGKPLAIGQIADDDFITSGAAKEKLFECNEMQIMQVSKPKRATIGVVSRYQNPNKEKSGIPRPSFGVTSSTTKKTIIHGPIRPAATPKKTTAMTSNNKKLSASVSSATKNAQNIQGFAVDFQADSNALDSIMNEKGIERLPNTPSYQQASRLSSQFGPVRDTRLNPKKQNRMAPFGRQSVIVGNRERQEFQSQNRSSFNATNQRWSVFSRRDSYSSKPFLMEWLQNLAEESKAKRLAAKQKEQEQKEINKLQTAENSTIDVSGNVHRGSFLFRKTLVGYQGDQHKQSEKSDIVPSTITEDDEGSSTAPATPHRPIPTTSGKDTMSTVKSILKKRTTTLSQATVDSERPRAMRSLTMKGVGTPARQNTMSKLPLPKQQRDQMTVQYDKEKKKSVKWVDEQEKSTIEEPAIATTRNNKSNHNATPRRSPIKTRSSTKTPPSGIKSQYRLTESVSVTPTRSPAASDHKYFTRSKPNVVSESIDLSTSNTDKMTHTPTKSRELSASPVTSSPSRHSPTSSRSHQIKYVMPAEQPMEQRTLPIGNLLDQSNRTNNSNKSILNPNKMQESESVIPRKGDDSSKKSWAQVLGEELDPYGNKENRTEEPAKTKKKKKRNFKRCSALEQIYGKNIYLNNEVDSPEAPSTNMTVDSPGWASKLHDSSRPLPALDNKVIGDLMSFNNDDANTDLMDLEDSRFLSIIKASQSQSMMENTGKLHQENPPMQSTLLQTPARDEYREKIEILTPVVDAGQKQPDAPGRRQSTKARTPYKQAMLDILYRTLAEANKKRKDGDETIVDATIVGDIEETLLNDTREDHGVIESQINTKETETSRQGMGQLHQNQPYSPKSNSSIYDTMLQNAGNDRKPLNVPNPRSPSLKLFEQSATKTPNGILMESSIQDMSLEIANDSPMPLRGDLTPTSELINKMHPKDTNNECDRVKLESKPGFSAPVPFRVVSDPNTQILQNKDETKALTRPSFSLNAPSLFPAPPLFNNLEKSSKFSAVPNAGSSTSQRSFSTSSKPTAHSARSSFLKPSQFSTSLNNHRSIITSMNELTLTIPQSAVTKSLDVFPAPQLFSSLGHGQKSKFSSTLSQQKNNKNLTQDTNSTLSFALKPSTISVQREQQPLTNQLPSFQATTNQLFSSKPFFGSSLFAAQPLFSGLGGDKKNKFSKLRDTKTITESMPNINNTLTSYQQPNNSLPTYSSPLKDSATKVTSSTILKPSLISLSKDCSAFRPIKLIPQSNDHQQSPDSPQDIQLNTEIQVYTKMGEEYKDLLHSMARERIDGAFNPIAKLLMHGDEQHFIPIEGSYCVAR